ncbi:zf-HC2 domain-containing protein [bacterium]|nr:zf-HC2 domain-containing protein [bacterium]
MKCGRYGEWMLLNRPGELDEKSGRELEQHLAACPECRAARLETNRGMRLAALAAERMRQTQPIPSAGMTDRILSAVAREKRPEPARRPWTVPFLPARTGRLVLSGAAACAVLFFAGQEALVLRRVARLEDRMAGRSSVRPAGTESWTELRSRISESVPLDQDRVTVRRSDLEALVRLYPDDPAVRALAGSAKRLTRGRDGGRVSVPDLVRHLEKDPIASEWVRQMEKRGGKSWNRI